MTKKPYNPKQPLFERGCMAFFVFSTFKRLVPERPALKNLNLTCPERNFWLRADYTLKYPPSTTICDPFMKDALSDNRNVTTSAISFGSLNRPDWMEVDQLFLQIRLCPLCNQRCHDISRMHGIDADPFLAEFDRRRFRQSRDPVFGSDVYGEVLNTDKTSDGKCIDDRFAA